MCVQVMHAPSGDVHVADCHHPDDVWLIFGAEEWGEFLAEQRGAQAVYARRHRRVRLKDPTRARPVPPSVAETRAAEPWWVQASALGRTATPPWRTR